MTLRNIPFVAVLLGTLASSVGADEIEYALRKNVDFDQEIPLHFTAPGSFVYRYELDPFIVGPAVYGPDFVFLDPQAETTQNRMRLRVRAGKPLPRSPIPRTTLPLEVLQFYAARANQTLPPGSLPHEMFEFFAKGVVGQRWAEGDVPEKVLPARYNVAGLGYHVERFFDGPQDFQAVGLTSSIWFRLRVDRLTPDRSALLERRFMYVNIHDVDRPPVLAIRGTEFTEGDILTDGNPRGVGYDQFVTNGASLEQWLRQVSEPFQLSANPDLRAMRVKPHVTGHSLGGALTQWLAASYTSSAGILGQVVTFNAAGITRDAGSFGADYFRPENVDSVTHYVVSGDPVSIGGEAFLPPAAGGNLGQPGWVLFSYTKTSTVAQLRKHSIPMLIDERLLSGEWVANPIKNPNPLAPPPSVALFATPEGSLNDPLFTYLPDPDYFAFLNGIARSGGGNLAAAAVFRESAEAARADLGIVMLSAKATLDVARGPALWKSKAWNAILKMTQKKLDDPRLNLNRAATTLSALSGGSGEFGFWDASPSWDPAAWVSSPTWDCGWDAMSDAWGTDQWNRTLTFNDVAWRKTETWDCGRDWPGAGGSGDPNDSTPPFCQLTALPGEPITGPVTFTVTAFDLQSKISKVVLEIDRQAVGVLVGPRTDDRYSFNWTPPADTKALPLLEARCFDNGAPPNEKADFRVISVNTKGAQDGPPKLDFINVVQGRGWPTPIPKVQVKATDNQGVTVQLGVQGPVSGVLEACTAADCNCGPDCFAFDWQPPAGRYTLTAVGIEKTGTARLVSNLRAENVLIDGSAPSVAFTAPRAGDVLDRPVTVALNATDDIGLIEVSLHALAPGDAAYKAVGTTSQPPYSFRFCPARPGLTSLKAVAVDSALRSAESVIQVQAPAGLNCNVFSISLAPSSVSLGTGSSTAVQVRTSVEGAPQQVALSISGLPAGVTGSFNPPSIAAGQISTLTIAADNGATEGTTKFTVTGSGSAASTSSVDGQLTVVAEITLGDWVQFNPATNPPRAVASQLVDTPLGVLRFGGVDEWTYSWRVFGDLWRWDGSTWVSLTPNPLPAAWPAARADHVMAYDSDRNRLVLSGGVDANQKPLRDLWEYDLATGVWHNRTPNPLPTAWPNGTGSRTASYDPGLRTTVLLWGQKMWLWSGADGTWTYAAAALPEVGRSLAYDASRRRMVHYGLQEWSCNARASLHEWDGGSWRVVDPAARPSLVGGLVYDSARSVLLLLGFRICVWDEQLWQLDGADWRRIKAEKGGAPPYALYLSLAYDSAHQMLLMLEEYGNGTYGWRADHLEAADLSVRALGWPTTAARGSLVNLTYQVRNEGDAAANSGYVNQLYVDGQPVPNSGNQTGSRSGPALAPDGSDTNAFAWSATCGVHTVEARTDATDLVDESNQANNATRPAHTLTVACSPFVELSAPQPLKAQYDGSERVTFSVADHWAVQRFAWQFRAYGGAGFTVVSGCERGNLSNGNAKICTIQLTGGQQAQLQGMRKGELRVLAPQKSVDVFLDGTDASGNLLASDEHTLAFRLPPPPDDPDPAVLDPVVP